MSWSWHAKVHKSGSKVAVFNGSKLVKVVEASKETFEPAEAQKFAEDLVNELAGKTSSQMSAPSEQPSVTTEGELQSAVLNAVTTQAQGVGAGAAPVAAPVAPVVPEELDEGSEENTEGNEAEEPAGEDEEEKIAKLMTTVASLKKKLAIERNDRVVERKARRGLAIAKQLVAERKLEDSYEAIKTKIAQIVKLEDSEIDRLERKIAGEHEFISIDEAQKELRRQSRIERINRQAAAEAQEDDDIEQAEMLDSKADEAEAKVAHIQSVIETMTKSAEEEAGTEEKPEAEEKPAEAPAAPVVEKKEEEKSDATTPAEVAPETPAAPVTPEASSNATNKLAELARNYRLIASHHRKLAEEAEAKGDIAAADKQDALGDAAEENAEEVEKKLAECSSAPVVEEEKADDAETPTEEATETPEEESAEAPAKESSREPGKTVTSSKHQPLKRDNETIEDSSFGIDKNASLVEQNDFSGDPEVEVLSKMWRGAPRDE